MANDSNDNGAINSDDSFQSPESFSYVIDGTATTAGLDSVVHYNAEVLYGDGTTQTLQLWVIQLQNGDSFVTWGDFAFSDRTVQTITLTSVANADYDGLYVPSDSITNLRFVCFARGTQIATPQGEAPVETLRPGHLVLTRQAGPQPVLWVAATAATRLTGGNAPVRFARDALGPGRPARPLVVTGQHRLLLPGRAALGPARAFLGLPGVARPGPGRRFGLVTFLLPRHALVRANGVWAESFGPGRRGLPPCPPPTGTGCSRCAR